MIIIDKLKKGYSRYRDRKIISALKAAQNIVVHDSRRLAPVKGHALSDEQKKQIDDFYITNYGEKIDHTCHLTYLVYSGKFDPQYVPEQLYIPEIERFLNLHEQYCKVLENKSILPRIAKTLGIKSPETYFDCSMGMIYDNKGKIVTKEQVVGFINTKKAVFAKPTVDSGGGSNCYYIEAKEGIDTVSSMPVSCIIDRLGENYTIQECIKCSNSIRTIYSHSVNTFRVMTYRWKNEIRYASAVMRIGIGGMHVDNASSGGIFVAIDKSGKLRGGGKNEYGKKYDEHPDTKVKFDGYKIDDFDKVVDSAMRLHATLPMIGAANWDFTIDENEDVTLIEGNFDFGSPWLFQMTHGVSVFGEHTADILQWVRKMKAMDVQQRRNHLFGN